MSASDPSYGGTKVTSPENEVEFIILQNQLHQEHYQKLLHKYKGTSSSGLASEASLHFN